MRGGWYLMRRESYERASISFRLRHEPTSPPPFVLLFPHFIFFFSFSFIFSSMLTPCSLNRNGGEAIFCLFFFSSLSSSFLFLYCHRLFLISGMFLISSSFITARPNINFLLGRKEKWKISKLPSSGFFASSHIFFIFFSSLSPIFLLYLRDKHNVFLLFSNIVTGGGGDSTPHYDTKATPPSMAPDPATFSD